MLFLAPAIASSSGAFVSARPKGHAKSFTSLRHPLDQGFRVPGVHFRELGVPSTSLDSYLHKAIFSRILIARQQLQHQLNAKQEDNSPSRLLGLMCQHFSSLCTVHAVPENLHIF